ncbi:MAG: DUF4199 domain-containing protein [Mucilaginibacter polytrichastri]|nr:DUF4199 domain-containing protein [Mucilaginibacter polytrichastri]
MKAGNYTESATTPSMKNAIQFGLLIGILSALWIIVSDVLGLTKRLSNDIAPFEYTSGLIPLIGLYLGVRNFRNNYKGGEINFFEAIAECFKILLIGGAIAAFSAFVYMQYFSTSGETTAITDYSARLFGALLIGVLFSLTVSILLMTKPRLL